MNRFSWLIALTLLLALGGQALARHVTHPVTPKNIDKQAFAFSVQVKDVEGLKEFVITVRQQPGKLAPVDSATGSGMLASRGNKPGARFTVTREQANGAQTYLFRLSPADVERAYFTFTETPEDWRRPFAAPGDYWMFHLSDFAGDGQ